MTPAEFRQARLDLGLSVADYAAMLGCHPGHMSRLQMPQDAHRHRTVTDTMARLIRAYLSGYRPPDWPVAAKCRTRARKPAPVVRPEPGDDIDDTAAWKLVAQL